MTIKQIIKKHNNNLATEIQKTVVKELKQFKPIAGKIVNTFNGPFFKIGIVVNGKKYTLKYNDISDEDIQFHIGGGFDYVRIGKLNKEIPAQITKYKLEMEKAKEYAKQQKLDELDKTKLFSLTKRISQRLKKLDDKGYSELLDLTNGEISLREYADIINNMSTCEPESSAEWKIKEMYDDAVTDLNHYLLTSKQITQSQFEFISQ